VLTGGASSRTKVDGVPRPVHPRSLFRLACQGALLVLLIAGFVTLRIGEVSGESMTPTLAPGEAVAIDAREFWFGAPRRGEIVAFRHDRSGPSLYVKRVVGTGGDVVAVRRGVVTVDGRAVADPSGVTPGGPDFAQQTVPAGTYFVLGDDRPGSEDSRAWGFVDARDVLGRAFFGLWPPARIGFLR